MALLKEMRQGVSVTMFYSDRDILSMEAWNPLVVKVVSMRVVHRLHIMNIQLYQTFQLMREEYSKQMDPILYFQDMLAQEPGKNRASIYRPEVSNLLFTQHNNEALDSLK